MESEEGKNPNIYLQNACHTEIVHSVNIQWLHQQKSLTFTENILCVKQLLSAFPVIQLPYTVDAYYFHCTDKET